ncbi:NYN domainlimkain-b1-type [Penicillium lividum]|nr:NYN domainlimkain-b1-type [Penicillium lividum]
MPEDRCVRGSQERETLTAFGTLGPQPRRDCDSTSALHALPFLMAGDNISKLAVLIDADNAQFSIINLLLSEIAKYGAAFAKRA